MLLTFIVILIVAVVLFFTLQHYTKTMDELALLKREVDRRNQSNDRLRKLNVKMKTELDKPIPAYKRVPRGSHTVKAMLDRNSTLSMGSKSTASSTSKDRSDSYNPLAYFESNTSSDSCTDTSNDCSSSDSCSCSGGD